MDTAAPHPLVAQERSLNVNDALGYLDSVKVQFHEQPLVYNQFLEIMKEFKSQRIDTPGVIERVSHLFYGHQQLISGFNTFLPAGYSIQYRSPDTITFTSPAGMTTIHPQRLVPPPPPPPVPPPRARSRARSPGGDDSVTITSAFEYIQRIKKRCDPETYKEFLDILSRYHKKSAHVDDKEVLEHIGRLFKDEPDFYRDFHHFLPEISEGSEKPRMDAVVPQKRKRRDREKEREKDRDRETKSSSTHHKSKTSAHDAPSSKHERRHAPPPPRSDDSQFFERVKRALGSNDSYTEFLKFVNLFTQGMIDTGRLLKETRNFLLVDLELLKQFKEILGWDERREREYVQWERDQPYGFTRPIIAGFQDRPTRTDMGIQYGSYRKLSPAESNVNCAGRDDMCKSVLNDEWVSHPTWSSEDPPIVSNRKNMFEEALHRSEEERHEYDFHIEAITRTIAILEPINNKIAQLNSEERASFKVKPNLNGSAKAINHRVIKKIWGREGGNEVIQAMQDTPSQAIPVVLQRLKVKEEEWKRAQREWNKVWREVEARNYVKSLDQQSITFKATDKKALTIKAFVSQIEAAQEEQMAKRSSLIDPLFARTRPRHQLEYTVEDMGVIQDVLKLTFSFLDRTQGQIVKEERRRIETFLRVFVPLFFMQDPAVFNSAFALPGDGGAAGSDVEMSDGSDAESASGSVSGKGKGKKGLLGAGGDLRKKLLKSEQAKSTNRQTRPQDAEPSSSRLESPTPGEGDGANNKPKKGFFFTNTTFYVLLRLLEVLYSRLSLFRDLVIEQPASNPTAVSLGLSAETTAFIESNLTDAHANHYYELMLDSCERLFDNELEQSAFEDQMRHMFGVKHAYKIFTIDKVIGSLIKQVQSALADQKSNDLLNRLKTDRGVPVLTIQDQINSRHNAEKILGPDENLFRIDWLPESKTMTIQLIGKDDTSFDDSEVLTGRWQEYIKAYVSTSPTSSSLGRVRSPFLKRNMPVHPKEPTARTSDGLEIKVCVRTYRLFFVQDTEDYLWKIRDKEETERSDRNLRKRNLLRKKWLKDLERSPPVNNDSSIPS
ncbi:hypothetical protein CPB85DRAFT_1230305 [Mucidula mucida]|nr:hypothetical protein CPB85DRAFT_1230305 [Mucidula mucida]